MNRSSRRQVLAGLAAGAAFAPGQLARAQSPDVSDWVASDHARLRLIDAGPVGTGRLAGLQIQLDPGYLTYWRTPGEAGLPPTPDFSASENLASAALQFPAPERYDEGGAEAFGYKDDVVFPVTVAASNPARPLILVLSLSFAVCGELCLPASAVLRLGLGGSGIGPEADLVRSAERLVPATMPLGGPGPLAVLAIEPGAAPDRARVVVRAEGSGTPALFVEAPEPWYIHADGGTRLDSQRVAFALQVLAGAKQPAPVDVVLTLAADGRAVQVPAHLPAAAKP